MSAVRSRTAVVTPDQVHSAYFGDELDVVEAVGLVVGPEGACVRFGDDAWDFSSVDGLPAWTHGAGASRARFDLIPRPHWRVAAKEAALTLIAEQVAVTHHVTAVRVPLPIWSLPDRVRDWARWLTWLADGGTEELSEITQEHCDAYLAERSRAVQPDALRGEVTAMRDFAWCAPVMSAGSYRDGFYPWPDVTAAKVAGYAHPGENRTPVIPDEVLAPLIAAMLAVLRAPAVDVANATERLRDGDGGPYPVTPIPGSVGSDGAVPWSHHPLSPEELRHLRPLVVLGCFNVVAALSGMRLSEILELRRGCLRRIDAGDGKVRWRCHGVLVKGARRGTPAWWTVTTEVAEAIGVLERLAHPTDDALLFSLADPHRSSLPAWHYTWPRLRSWVNSWSSPHLAPIPEDWPLSPRQFRRTLARHLAARPWGTLAGMVHLKHLSIVTTEGYVGSHGAAAGSFARLLADERARMREEQAVQLFTEWRAGRPLSGPGARSLALRFEAVAAELGPFEGAVDPSDEDLRRRLRHVARELHSLPLNWCVFSDPTRARCLRGASSTTAQDQPLALQCQPLVCVQAVMTEEHVVVWRNEGSALRSLLADRRLPTLERVRLAPRLKQIDHLTGEDDP